MFCKVKEPPIGKVYSNVHILAREASGGRSSERQRCEQNGQLPARGRSAPGINMILSYNYIVVPI